MRAIYLRLHPQIPLSKLAIDDSAGGLPSRSTEKRSLSIGLLSKFDMISVSVKTWKILPISDRKLTLISTDSAIDDRSDRDGKTRFQLFSGTGIIKGSRQKPSGNICRLISCFRMLQFWQNQTPALILNRQTRLLNN
jgi:hypothetical protein